MQQLVFPSTYILNSCEVIMISFAHHQPKQLQKLCVADMALTGWLANFVVISIFDLHVVVGAQPHR
jgi:hypothetical protein